MSEKAATERVTQALFDAIGGVVEKIKEDGDTDAVDKIGPVLMTTGVMILVQTIGAEATAKVVSELSARVERGDFSQAGNIFGI